MNPPTPAAPSVFDGDGLSDLPPALRALADCGVERRYRKGTIFIREGEPGGPLFFIMRGRVRAFATRGGRQEFTFGYHGPGSYLGEMSLDGGPRSASVVAEGAVTCRLVTQVTLEQCIARDPKLAIELMINLIRRVRELSARATDLALDDAYGRLAELLRKIGVPQDDGTLWMPVALTQAQMAQQIGCSRPMVTRLIGELVRGQYLRQDSKRWRVLKALPASYRYNA